MNSGFGTIHIFDNGLKSKMGHHFNYDRAIACACRRKGMEATVWGHASLSDPAILDEARPHFRHYLYDRYAPSEVNHAVEVHVQDLKAAVERIAPTDLVFVPNLLNVDVAALKQLVMQYRIPNPLGLLVRYRDNVSGPEAFEFLSLLRTICNLHGPTTVFTDTQALREALEGNGIPAQMINFPIEIPYTDLQFEERFDFAYVGQVAPHKGFMHATNALLVGAQIGFTPRVAMQCTLLDDADLARLRESLPHVTWIPETLDTHAYYQLMASSDTILTFYDPDLYPVNSSNILIEALSLNRRVLSSRFPHAAEILQEDLPLFSAFEYSHNALLQKMVQMHAERFLPRSYLRRADTARNLANPGLLVDTLVRRCRSAAPSIF